MADSEPRIDKAEEKAKEIYEIGRQASIKAKPFIEKAIYYIWKHNLFPIIVISILAIYGIYYLDSLLHRPSVQASGYIEANTERPLVSFETPPIKNAKKKIEITTKKEDQAGDIIDYKLKLWTDQDNAIWVHKDDYEMVKVVEKHSKVDFTFRFGIGLMIVPEAKDAKTLFEPVLTLSPVEFFNRFSVDLYSSHKRGGFGGSYRLPFNRFKNTYIGGGIAYPYSGMVDKISGTNPTLSPSGILFVKVNF